MRTLIQFSPASNEQLSSWRSRYIQSLPHAQQLLLELLCKGAQGWWVLRKEQPLGYVLIARQDTVVEYYLDPCAWIYADETARQIVSHFSLRRALVKSFDALMLSGFIELQTSVSVLGYITRDYQPKPLPDLPAANMTGQLATAKDFDRLWAVEQEVFDNAERFAAAIASGEVYVYEHQERTIGFGMLREVRPDIEGREINLAVDTPYRRRGYAVYLLRDLVNRCLAMKLEPLASCAKSNVASRLMGERIGFSARHRLLELSFPEQNAPEP